MTTRRLVRRLLLFGVCFGVLTLGMGRPVEAAITVTNLNDDLEPGSLRWAIQQSAPGDTIIFDIPAPCPCKIALASGELVIDKDLTIVGPGPDQLTISGESASRVFRIAELVVAQLQGLAVRNGNGVGGGLNQWGGGIRNEGTLTLINMIVADNRATAMNGGGIYSRGALTIRNSRFTLNRAANGGAIAAEGSLLMLGSTITNNAAEGGNGGGVSAPESSSTIVGSTFADNSATISGGGIDVSRGSLTLVNSTLSGNSALFGGAVLGAAAGLGPTMVLVNTTVTGNNATGSSGGGLSVPDPNVQIVLNNSIVAGNTPEDVWSDGTVSNNSSLVGGDVTTILDSTLADNGGPTQTHALVPNSPAINTGNNGLLLADIFDLDGDGDTTEALDQRGFLRVFGARVDIGSFEVVCTAVAVTPTVLPAASVGVAYSQRIVASGGAGPYTFSSTGLAAGLTLSADGLLTGTPSTSGTSTVTVTITDGFGCGSTEVTYTLTIADPSCGIVIGPATLKTPYLATLYYQPLSVTPSGQYAVTVSAGALPQGVYLFAIGRSWFLGGIPAKPGEYTFTLATKKQNSPCAPTRTFTVIVPATVLPQLTCVAKTGAKQYTAHFGYDNSTGGVVGIPVGTNNYFTPGVQDRGQVTMFQKGRVTNAFSVMFTVKNNHTDLALWYLRGPDNVRRPVNITTATSRCP